MTKRRFKFGNEYIKNCRLGIAMIQGERHYWLTDGYTRWLITDMDPFKQTFTIKLWA